MPLLRSGEIEQSVNFRRRGRQLRLESGEPCEGCFGLAVALRGDVYGDVSGKSACDGEDEGQWTGSENIGLWLWVLRW